MYHFGLYYRKNDLAFGTIESGLLNNAKSKFVIIAYIIQKNYITVRDYH